MSECLRIAELVDRLGRIAHGLQYASGLNPAQWEVLRFIARANRFSRYPGAIARYLGTTRGTISQTLIALESKGYIRRKRCDADRRAVSIELTETGHALIGEDPLCLVLKAADALSCEEQERLADGLDRLVRAVQGAKGMPDIGPCLNCVHYCPADEGPSESACRCALNGEALEPAETRKICVDFETGPAA